MLLTRLLTSAALATIALILAGAPARTQAASAADYVPGEVVVGYAPRPLASVAADLSRRMGIRAAAPAPAPAPGAGVQVLRLPRGLSVAQAIAGLRHQPGIAYAVPNYIAHAAGSWIPDDRGRTNVAGGWGNCNGTSCRVPA